MFVRVILVYILNTHTDTHTQWVEKSCFIESECSKEKNMTLDEIPDFRVWSSLSLD